MTASEDIKSLKKTFPANINGGNDYKCMWQKNHCERMKFDKVKWSSFKAIMQSEELKLPKLLN